MPAKVCCIGRCKWRGGTGPGEVPPEPSKRKSLYWVRGVVAQEDCRSDNSERSEWNGLCRAHREIITLRMPGRRRGRVPAFSGILQEAGSGPGGIGGPELP